MPLNSKQPDWSLQLASFVMSFAKSKASGGQNRREDIFCGRGGRYHFFGRLERRRYSAAPQEIEGQFGCVPSSIIPNRKV